MDNTGNGVDGIPVLLEEVIGGALGGQIINQRGSDAGG